MLRSGRHCVSFLNRPQDYGQEPVNSHLLIGFIRHIGLSNVSPEQFTEGQSITEIVCVQNLYNVALRKDDGLIGKLELNGLPPPLAQAGTIG